MREIVWQFGQLVVLDTSEVVREDYAPADVERLEDQLWDRLTYLAWIDEVRAAQGLGPLDNENRWSGHHIENLRSWECEDMLTKISDVRAELEGKAP